MYKKLIIFLIISIVIVSFPYNITANETNDKELFLTISFNDIDIEKINFEGNIYSRIKMNNTSVNVNPGEPALPVKSISILLPPHSNIKNIEVKGDLIKNVGNYIIEPCQKQYPISKISSASYTYLDKDILNSSSLYPGKKYDLIDIQKFRGYDILFLDLYPVQYKPRTGELFYYKELILDISINKVIIDNFSYRGLEKDKNLIKNVIENTDFLTEYKNTLKFGNSYDSFQYLLITSEELSSNFQTLIDFHNSRGISTKIVTVEEIYRMYSGDDKILKIKNYIRECYNNNQTEYVLLGGDFDTIPCKYITITVPDYLPEEIPSDQWYTQMDNDELLPEIPDIYIGRACVDTAQEVDYFISKTRSYVEGNINDNYKTLLAGEDLDWAFGKDYMEELIDDCNNNNYQTTGIPSDKFCINRLYDRDRYWVGYWNKNDILEELNDHISIVNHLGHSGYNNNMKLQNSDIINLNNENYFFVYSQGCRAGGFDNPQDDDCIAEYFTTKTANGAFAGIWNTRYGWGGPRGTTDGSSQKFQRYFWDEIYTMKNKEIGVANQNSKINIFNDILSNKYYEYSYWTLTLFGDPTIEIKTPSAIYPEKIIITEDEENEEISFELNHPLGKDIKLFVEWGDGTYSDWLGPYNSGEKISLSHEWVDEKSKLIKAKSKDLDGFESPWSEYQKITEGELYVTIYDEEDETIDLDATVTANNINNGKTYPISKEYWYFFSRIPGGEYLVSVTNVDGYKNASKTISFENGEHTGLKFNLQKSKAKNYKNINLLVFINRLIDFFKEKFNFLFKLIFPSKSIL